MKIYNASKNLLIGQVNKLALPIIIDNKKNKKSKLFLMLKVIKAKYNIKLS